MRRFTPGLLGPSTKLSGEAGGYLPPHRYTNFLVLHFPNLIQSGR